MSLQSILQLGSSALSVQQAALQITSNNIANAGNPDYTRQLGSIVPGADYQNGTGFLVGSGVSLTGINRQIDNSLLLRLRSATSDSSAADTTQSWTSRIESVYNALGTNNLSSQMSTFFNSWSKLASNPQDSGLRQIVLTNGDTLAKTFNDLSRQFAGLQQDIGDRTAAQADAADAISQQIADLNGKITVAEGGSASQANGLRDQRDALVKQLSGIMNVTTTEDKGSLNVFVGSQPLVIGSTTRGVAVRQVSSGAGSETQLVFKDDMKTELPVTGGELGGLANANNAIKATTSDLNSLAKSLVFELNKVHSSGQGLTGLTNVTSQNPVLNSNARLDSSAAGLTFPPQNGSFVVTVTSKTTGLTTSKLIKVDLAPGSASPTTLNSLAASIGDTSINATVSGGQLKISAASPDLTISFSQDSSNTLASLGINTFFSGDNAASIGVSAQLLGNPALLAAAQNGSAGDNQTALAIASLDTKSLSSLSGLTLRQGYDTAVSTVASTTAAAKTSSAGASIVLQTLQAQRESLSGVSLDEESVNLITQQRAFQGAARIISTVDDMMQTVLGLVR